MIDERPDSSRCRGLCGRCRMRMIAFNGLGFPFRYKYASTIQPQGATESAGVCCGRNKTTNCVRIQHTPSHLSCLSPIEYRSALCCRCRRLPYRSSRTNMSAVLSLCPVTIHVVHDLAPVTGTTIDRPVTRLSCEERPGWPQQTWSGNARV